MPLTVPVFCNCEHYQSGLCYGKVNPGHIYDVARGTLAVKDCPGYRALSHRQIIPIRDSYAALVSIILDGIAEPFTALLVEDGEPSLGVVLPNDPTVRGFTVEVTGDHNTEVATVVTAEDGPGIDEPTVIGQLVYLEEDSKWIIDTEEEWSATISAPGVYTISIGITTSATYLEEEVIKLMFPIDVVEAIDAKTLSVTYEGGTDPVEGNFVSTSVAATLPLNTAITGFTIAAEGRLKTNPIDVNIVEAPEGVTTPAVFCSLVYDGTEKEYTLEAGESSAEFTIVGVYKLEVTLEDITGTTSKYTINVTVE